MVHRCLLSTAKVEMTDRMCQYGSKKYLMIVAAKDYMVHLQVVSAQGMDIATDFVVIDRALTRLTR